MEIIRPKNNSSGQIISLFAKLNEQLSETTKVFMHTHTVHGSEVQTKMQSKLIRRFIPKGVNIGEFSHERIKMIEHWINNYPRRIFGGLSSNMVKIHLNVT